MKADRFQVTFLVLDDFPPANKTMGKEDSWMANPLEWQYGVRVGICLIEEWQATDRATFWPDLT